MALVWTYDTAAHLLRRAWFGHNGLYTKNSGEARQVRFLANLSQAAAVDFLLNIPVSKTRGPGGLNGDDNVAFAKLQKWWLDRMWMTRNPLREKMVLFLHTHFATARSKVNKPMYMAVQNALFREFAVGDFRELVKRATVDAAMLWWLDGNLNKVGKPNENYARELQELFTIGVFDFNGQPNYAQDDVKQAARILTGWRFREDKGKIIVEFRPGRHDPDPKTVYAPVPGETPNQNASNAFTTNGVTPPPELEYALLVDKIFDHTDTEGKPTAARYIARKMWKFFAYDPQVDIATPRADLTLIDDLATAFKGNNYSLASLLRAMFLRDEFYADATRTVKSPTEYVIGTIRMLSGKVVRNTHNNLGSDTVASMGQDLFNPPDVFSWRGNQRWVTTQTLLKRYDFARDFAQGDKGRHSELGFNPNTYLDTNETTRAGVVDRFLKLLGPLMVDGPTKTQLINWLGATDGDMHLTDPNYVQVYVRGLVNLILTLPHYHVH